MTRHARPHRVAQRHEEHLPECKDLRPVHSLALPETLPLQCEIILAEY